MNIGTRLKLYTDRGFTRRTAAVNVLIEEALQALFTHFPDTFLFFGGASLVLFYGSPRHSGDLDLLVSTARPPGADQLRGAIERPLTEVAEALEFSALQIETAGPREDFARLLVKSGRELLFTIDLTKVSAAIHSEINQLPLVTGVDPVVLIALPSRNLELLFKAEAFLIRRALKVRDAFDIKLLVDSGAVLNDDLKSHLSDGPAAEKLETPEFIVSRIKQINASRCRAELQPYLPSEIYSGLAQLEFKPIRDAVKNLFAEWLRT